MLTTHPTQPLTAAKRSRPCPVCQKPSWCGYTEDYAVCMRVQSDKQTANGGWLHRLQAPVVWFPVQKPVEKEAKVARASDAYLDRIYRELIDRLSLSPTHRQNLLARGLTEKEIEGNMYRSSPESGIVISGDLSDVPGFSRWHGLWQCQPPNGILIPLRDKKRRVIGFQVRLDNPRDAKYVWLSSSRWGGPSPGTRPHLAAPAGLSLYRSEMIWITEGFLKADIAAARLNAVVIGVPGVNCWRKVLPLVDVLAPATVAVAYDSDYEKDTVRFHARALSDALLKTGHKVYAALWPKEAGKGIDDALKGNAKIKLARVRPVPMRSG